MFPSCFVQDNCSSSEALKPIPPISHCPLQPCHSSFLSQRTLRTVPVGHFDQTCWCGGCRCDRFFRTGRCQSRDATRQTRVETFCPFLCRAEGGEATKKKRGGTHMLPVAELLSVGREPLDCSIWASLQGKKNKNTSQVMFVRDGGFAFPDSNSDFFRQVPSSHLNARR